MFSKNMKHRLNVYASTQHTQRQSYYGTNQNPDAYGHTPDMTFVGGAQYSYEWVKCLFLPATFTGGMEYNYDGLKDEMLGYNRIVEQ